LKGGVGDSSSVEKLLALENRLEDAARLNESYEVKLQEMAVQLKSYVVDLPHTTPTTPLQGHSRTLTLK